MLTNEPLKLRYGEFRTDKTIVGLGTCRALMGSHCRYEIASQSPFRVEKTKSPRGLVNLWGISSPGDGKGITRRVLTRATAQKGRADYGCGIAAPAGTSQIPPTTMASSAAPVSSIR